MNKEVVEEKILPEYDEKEQGPQHPLFLAELERLAILSEECAEVQQVIGKIIRHGYESYNPFDETKTTNRILLEQELGDLIFSIGMLTGADDVDQQSILDFADDKAESIQDYLHYNSLVDEESEQ